MNNLSILLNEAHQLFKAGDIDNAASLYRRILKSDADNLPALTSIGTICLSQGNYEESAHWLKQALIVDPDSVIANSNLGFISFQSGKYEEAATYLMSALKKEPKQAFLWYELGETFDKLNQPTGAIECFQTAITINPNYFDSYIKLSKLSIKQNNYHDAANYLTQAISLQSDQDILLEIYRCLFQIFNFKLCVPQKALHYAKMILEITPDHSWIETQRRLSIQLLLQGNFRESLSLFFDKNIYPRDGIARWQGEIFTGKRLIILDDNVIANGFGDFLMFARYIPLVKERGGHVSVLVKKELFRLFKNLSGADALVFPQDIRNEDFDLQTPFIMLPAFFGNSLETIPAKIPYLKIEPELDMFWKNLLNSTVPDNKTLKVGLVWACVAGKISTSIRSCGFGFFTFLKNIPNITYYTLQIGEFAKEYLRPEYSDFNIIDLTAHINDFADTAGLVNNLDLIISVDTAVAHLSGALGKPVWLLLNFPPDWRWFSDRADSPWYPTMHLFRAKEENGWDSVFEDIYQKLQLVCKNRELLL